jgi:hypothetical protein
MPDPRLLVCKLLMGSQFTGTLPPSQARFTGIGTGIQVVADDGITVLTPTTVVAVIGDSGAPNSGNQAAALIQVKMHPYAQETQGEIPQVIVGPARPIKSEPMDVGSRPFYWMQMSVEIRVIAHDWYPGMGFTADGRSMRAALQENIKQIIERNYTNPDGTGTFSTIRVVDMGGDLDDASPGNPLLRTPMKVQIEWFEGTPT